MQSRGVGINLGCWLVILYGGAVKICILEEMDWTIDFFGVVTVLRTTLKLHVFIHDLELVSQSRYRLAFSEVGIATQKQS